MGSIAYALRAEHADSFGGAVICIGPNGEALDTKAALEEGDGKIVVSDNDQWTISKLDEHPQFKRVAVPDEPEVVVDRFEEMTVPQLRDEAQKLGVENPGRSRDDVLAAVRAAANPTEEA